MKICTIVSDMDDTLLNGEGKLSDYTLRILRECTKQGIRVIPASGRTSASIRPFVDLLQTGQPYICGNGSQLVSADHQVIGRKTIPIPQAKEVIRFLEGYGFFVQAYQDDCVYYSHACAAAYQYQHMSSMKGVEVGNLAECLDFESPKLLSICDEETVRKVFPVAEETFRGKVSFTISKPTFLECIPPDVSKGNALIQLAGMINLQPETTLCFGDSRNDTSFALFTSNVVAVANARDEMKAVAAYHCLSNTEDGPARFIAQNVLNLQEVMAP